jgi:hypothetical protein
MMVFTHEQAAKYDFCAPNMPHLPYSTPMLNKKAAPQKLDEERFSFFHIIKG